MIDLHEGILRLFAAAQRCVSLDGSDAFGRFDAISIEPKSRARKTTRVRAQARCTSCGRRGHLATTCVNYQDWYDPPAWLSEVA